MDMTSNEQCLDEGGMIAVLTEIVQDAKQALERNDYDYAMPILQRALGEARFRMSLEVGAAQWPPIVSLIMATLAKSYEKRSLLRTDATDSERANDLNRARELYETASDVLMQDDEDDEVTDYGPGSSAETHHDC